MSVSIGNILQFQQAVVDGQNETQKFLPQIYDFLWWSSVLTSSSEELLQKQTLAKYITGGENESNDESLNHQLHELTQYLNDRSFEEIRIDMNRNVMLPVESMSFLIPIVATQLYTIYRHENEADTIIFNDASQVNIFSPEGIDLQCAVTRIRQVVFEKVPSTNRITRRHLPNIERVVRTSLGNAVTFRTLFNSGTINNGNIDGLLDKIERMYDELNMSMIHNNASIDTVFFLHHYGVEEKEEVKILNFSKSFIDINPSEHIRAQQQNWLAKAPCEPSRYRWDLLCFYVSALIFCGKIKQRELFSILYERFTRSFTVILNFTSNDDDDHVQFRLYDDHSRNYLIVSISDGVTAIWENNLYQLELKITDDEEDTDDDDGTRLCLTSRSLDILGVKSIDDSHATLITESSEMIVRYCNEDNTRFLTFQFLSKTDKALDRSDHAKAAEMGVAPQIIRHVFFHSYEKECRFRVDGYLQDKGANIDVLVTPVYNHTLFNVLSNKRISSSLVIEILSNAFRMLERISHVLPMNTRCFIENVVVTTKKPPSLSLTDNASRYYLLTDFNHTWNPTDGSEEEEEEVDLKRYESEEMNNHGPIIYSKIYDRLCLIVSIAKHFANDDDNNDEHSEEFKNDIFKFLEGELRNLKKFVDPNVRINEGSTLSEIHYKEGANVLIIFPFNMSDTTRIDLN